MKGTNDRAHAIQTFRNLGFNIVTLGAHPTLKSHNSQIDFVRPGNTYIELIGMQPGWYGSLVGAIGASPAFSRFLSKISMNELDSRLLLGAPALRDCGLADYACSPPPDV